MAVHALIKSTIDDKVVRCIYYPPGAIIKSFRAEGKRRRECWDVASLAAVKNIARLATSWRRAVDWLSKVNETSGMPGALYKNPSFTALPCTAGL